MRALFIDEVKQEFINRGYIPLFNKYKNSTKKLLAQTQEGYKIVTTINNLKLGHIPQVFGKFNPHTIQNIKLWCKLNNKPFELLSDIYETNYKKLKWRCLKDNCGEIFDMCWNNIFNGCNCSCCAGMQVGLSNCLATKNPELAKQWHPIKNGTLTPYDVTYGSDKNVWWQCEKGHEWPAKICDRNRGNGCPYCAGHLPSKNYNLLICNLKLANEWDYDKNDKKPEEYTPNSHSKVWWTCGSCGYKWYMTIYNRNIGTGCPKCNNSKANNKIIDFCEVNKLNYFPEYKIKDCCDKLPLPFDVGVVDKNILYLIEADGKQHFYPVNFGGISDERALENLKIIQYHDQIKNKYCEKNKIKLLRIPYWDFDNIENILNKYFNL
jgi:hypothetical protein